MVVMDMNDVAREMGVLYALMEALKTEIRAVDRSINPETSPVDLGQTLALMTVYEDRFHEVYQNALEASVELIKDRRKGLDSIPF